MTDIGFIGLGTMGLPMAGHLAAAGHRLHLVKHRKAIPEDLLKGGAKEHGSAKDVTATAEVTILMLPDTPDVEAVLFGKDGVAAGLAAGPARGKLVIDMSSISPTATRDFAARIAKLGADYLDAPVSGGEVGAKAATLSIMVGGEDAVFERAKPLFEKMGKAITLVGKVGDGQVCKVANQIVVALNIEAAAEALLLASAAGADPARVRQALLGGFAASRVLEVHGERMIKRTFNPGFRINLHRKDLRLAQEAGKTLGVELPNTNSAAKLMDEMIAAGEGDRDHSALVRPLERKAKKEIA
jgi:2-hydroxy-3-oxopropionate reductase